MIRTLEHALDLAIGRLHPHLQGVLGTDPRTRARRATAVAQAELRTAARQGREPGRDYVKLLQASRFYLRVI